MAQFHDQIRIGLIPQLIKGISRALQKLPLYLHGTAISTSTVHHW